MTAIVFLQNIQIVEVAEKSRVLQYLGALYLFAWYLVVAAILSMIALMLVRFILNYADVNPFSRPVIFVRSLTDPFVNPVRRSLMGYGIQPNGAPLVVVLLTILVGAFAWMLASSLLNTAAGVFLSLTSRSTGGIVAFVGYILYGALSLYALLLLIRIVFSWGRVSEVRGLMRFLAKITDPLLVPLRHSIPPVGMFDISPIVAFIIITLFQWMVALTLLRGSTTVFFR